MNNPWLHMDGNIAKCDKEILLSLNAKVKSDRNKVILDLPPAPFYGNILKAKLLILILNPGFKEQDYEEQCTKDFAYQNVKCLMQAPDAKLFSIRSEYKNTSHGGWWSKHLLPSTDRNIRKEIFNTEDEEVYRSFFENNFAVAEFFPYHSQSTPSFINKELPSQKYTFRLVEEAISLKKQILIMRSSSLWLEHVPSLQNYPYQYLSSTQNVVLSERNVINPDGRKWSEFLRSLLE